MKGFPVKVKCSKAFCDLETFSLITMVFDLAQKIHNAINFKYGIACGFSFLQESN